MLLESQGRSGVRTASVLAGLAAAINVLILGCGKTEDPELQLIIERFGTEAKEVALAQNKVYLAVPKLETGRLSKVEYSKLYDAANLLEAAFNKRLLENLGAVQVARRRGALMVWARREVGLSAVPSIGQWLVWALVMIGKICLKAPVSPHICSCN